jgi:DNA invertase Pin-like site-specific DNA recombinase
MTTNDVPATFRQRKRASLYARLSVAADAENLSLDGMVADMRALCAAEGLEEIALHVDDGKSGGRRDRDEYQEWLADAKSGRCDVLINTNTDRLTREGLNVAAQILDVVEGKDPHTGKVTHRPVRLLDCNGIDSLHGDGFRFRFVIQAEVGRAERERIRDRARKRARNLRRAGRWGGGTPPFGYRAVENPEGAGWVLDIEPAEAAAIRDAADALLKPAPDPLTRVVRRMNHAGIKPRRAPRWTRQTLRRALTGDHILGRVSQGGRPLRDEEGEILAPFPPVLTLGQVTALRARLITDDQAPTGGGHPARILSGLLSCHACGADLIVHHATARTRDGKEKAPDRPAKIMYRCPTRSQGGICEKPVTVTAAPLEDYLTGLYLSAVGNTPMFKERTIVSGIEELAAIEEEIKETLADLATQADADTFAKLQRLQARQRELADVETESATELVPTGQTMAEHWAGAMTSDRRSMLDTAFEELVILPGRRGPKGMDKERLIVRWAAQEHDDYDAY